MDSPKIRKLRTEIYKAEEKISILRKELKHEEDKLNLQNAPNLVGKFFKKHTQTWEKEYLKIIQYNKKSNEYKCLHIRISYATGYHVALNWIETNCDIAEDGYHPSTKEEFNSVLQDIIGRLDFNSL